MAKIVTKTPRTFIPLGSRMLCRKMMETKKSSVLHTVERTEKKALFFEILAVGPDCDPELQVGRCFYTGQYAEGWLDWPGQPDWYFINSDDAVGLVGDFDICESNLEAP